MRSSLTLLCVVLLGAPALASQQLLRDCAAHADAESVGLEELDADCPGLTQAVQDSEYSSFISDAQAQQLTRDSLQDLLTLQARYEERATPGPSLDPAAVATALQGLQRASPQPIKPKSWWELFKEWVSSHWLDVYDKDNWLSRWLQRSDLPAKMALALLVGASVLILVAAIVILVNELRASGVFAQAHRRFAAAAESDQSATEMTLADVDAAAVGERLPLLFKLLTTALRHAGRLKSDLAMTHREVARRAGFDAVEQQRQFGEIALLAERTLYGGRGASEAELEHALQSGRTLYVQLSRQTLPVLTEPRA